MVKVILRTQVHESSAKTVKPNAQSSKPFSLQKNMLIRKVVENFDRSALAPDFSDTSAFLFDKVCRYTNRSSANQKTIACSSCKSKYTRKHEHGERYWCLSTNSIKKVKCRHFKCVNCDDTSYVYPIRDASLKSYRKTIKNIVLACPETETMTAYQFAKQYPEQFALHCQNRFADVQGTKEGVVSNKMQYVIKPALLKFFYFLREVLQIPQDYFDDDDEDFFNWTRYCNLCKCRSSCHGKPFSCHEVREECRCFVTEKGTLEWKKETVNVCCERTNICNHCCKKFPMCHFNLHLKTFEATEAKDAWADSKLKCNYCFLRYGKNKIPKVGWKRKFSNSF